jgi:hypothetical protein
MLYGALLWGVRISTSLFFCSIANQIAHNYFEGYFVASDPALLVATAKYNYSMFDFAQAKKESHLKLIRRRLMTESPLSSIYTSPE